MLGNRHVARLEKEGAFAATTLFLRFYTLTISIARSVNFF